MTAHAEGEGATLGEAKWSAVKALEREHPGIASDDVTFEVLDEGSESDGRPARVRGEVDPARADVTGAMPDEPAERVRVFLARVVVALDLRASVDIEEDDEEIRATVNGDELGLMIGKHGSTIDALQHLAVRIAFRGLSERKSVVVDAAGDLEQALERHGVDAGAADPFRRLLEAWSREPDPHTAVPPEEAVDVHIADSLAALVFPEVERARTIADIGAGAGFPGLALAIAVPG